MPLKPKVKGSIVIEKRKPMKSFFPEHGYNTEEGYLPATNEMLEKLESLALSRYTTEEHRDIVKTVLNNIHLTRAMARETIMNCKSDWEINIDLARIGYGNTS
jgi:hypothetical protein